MLLRPAGFAAAVVLLMAAAVGAQVLRDRRYSAPRVGESLLYLRSGPFVDRLALSYDAVAADVYWMRAIQHFGGERLAGGRGGYTDLYPLLDITTSLDPRFTIAYRFGALFLAEPAPGGAGRPDLAIRLLRKGLAAMPAKWELMEDVGFVYYWSLGDYARAADAFRRAGELPGAPWWLRPLAATTALNASASTVMASTSAVTLSRSERSMNAGSLSRSFTTPPWAPRGARRRADSLHIDGAHAVGTHAAGRAAGVAVLRRSPERSRLHGRSVRADHARVRADDRNAGAHRKTQYAGRRAHASGSTLERARRARDERERMRVRVESG